MGAPLSSLFRAHGLVYAGFAGIYSAVINSRTSPPHALARSSISPSQSIRTRLTRRLFITNFLCLPADHGSTQKTADTEIIIGHAPDSFASNYSSNYLCAKLCHVNCSSISASRMVPAHSSESSKLHSADSAV